MRYEVVEEFASNLPAGDEHPYRSGAWRPNAVEMNAWDLEVEGDLPADLQGVYVRNTENPLHEAIGRYHPFDGDGMLHSIFFSGDGVEYRNRFIRTDGFNAELEAGRALWAGLMERPEKSERPGWGARTGLKDSSSTDVVVHNGKAVTSFYQCGDVYELDPRTLAPRGRAAWLDGVTPGWGVSAHTKVDEATGEMLFFNYSKEAPYMHYGVVDGSGELVHYIPINLPGPRLPHDMGFTDNYAILHDFPFFWDPDALKHNAHAVRFFTDLPTRFGVLPRRGQSADVRWFEFEPSYALHVINAYEHGDEVIMDGYAQTDPTQFSLVETGCHAYRWRMNLRTGEVREGPLEDALSEFGMINPQVAGKPYRYSWAVTSPPKMFIMDGLVRLDAETGERQTYALPKGVYLSESPMAPRQGSRAEDDGYVVSFVTDLNQDASFCYVFDAADIRPGPIAKVKLPQRICVGTHSYWADISTL
ncbi:MAG: carotenoid oxygenase family protein [Pseudomonadota bacterium]